MSEEELRAGKSPAVDVPRNLDGWWDAALMMALFIVAFAVLSPTVRNGFVGYDDDVYLINNPHMQTGLTGAGVAWSFLTFYASNWHPLTWLSHLGDVSLFGFRPAGHHLTSLLFHALNGALLFLALRRLTGERWLSVFVAAVFAVHPLHVESVAWIAERKDVLSTFFGFTALLAYERYQRTHSVAAYCLLTTFYALALLAKPMLVTLPFLLLLLDYWPLRRLCVPAMDGESWGTLVREKVPLFLLAAGSSVITVLAQRYGGAVATLDAIPFWPRMANALVAYWRYLGKAFWPTDLAIVYPHPGYDLGWGFPIGAALGLMLATFLLVRAGQARGYLAVGWLWFVGMLVPVIGVVQVGSQAMADRYMYMPLVGLTILVAWGLRDAVAGWQRGTTVLGYVAVAALAVLASVSQAQLTHWRNGETLFAHAVAVTRDNAIALYNLGTLELRRGDNAGAEKHLAEAVRVNPAYADAHANLGALYLAKGNLANAASHFTQALRHAPRDAMTLTNLAYVHMQQGKLSRAGELLQQALAIDPTYSNAIALNNQLRAMYAAPTAGTARR